MEPRMTGEELKTEAKKVRPITEWVWSKLEEDLFVQDAVLKDSPEEAVEFIINVYDECVAPPPSQRDRGGRGDDGRTDTVEVALNDLGMEHQAALEQYLAMCAACDIDVYRFRKKVLAGELLTEDQARELLGSPAAAILRTRRFREGNIPIIGHTAEVKSFESEVLPWGSSYVATIIVHPPGVPQEERMPSWDGTTLTENQRPVALEFPDEEGRIVARPVWSISLLGELRELGAKLSERYRWQPAHAVWFVLTAEIPAVPALTVIRSVASSMYHYDTLITVEASPWVSSRTVERAFRKAQIKTPGFGGGRPPGEKNLKLLRFVIERIEHMGPFEEGNRPPGVPEHMVGFELVAQYPLYRKMPNGNGLVHEWNETYPQWSYVDDTRRFWRDYHRIKKTVAFGPPYKEYAINSKDGVNGNDSLDGGAGTDTKVTDATEKSIMRFP
jgi:hypothetical protein